MSRSPVEPFDMATAVTPAGSGLYDATLSSTWAIGDKPHGGYLLALMGRAATEGVREARGNDDHPHPLSTSALFLSSPDFGPAQVQVEILRTGRSVTHAQATLVQGGKPVLRALQIFGALDGESEPRYLAEEAPPLPPWDECKRRPKPGPLPDGTVLRVGITEATEMRSDPKLMTGDIGGAPGSAELMAWLALGEERPHDPLSLLFALDAMPPVTFTLGILGWVPTLELTAYIRALPAPGPVQVRQRGRLLQDGRIDEVCDVWDSAGRLVGQASQLAGVRLPK